MPKYPAIPDDAQAAIRAGFRLGASSKELAEQFHLAERTVRNIVDGRDRLTRCKPYRCPGCGAKVVKLEAGECKTCRDRRESGLVCYDETRR